MQWASPEPSSSLSCEMPPSPDHQHYVRRVVLPSGKTIEVVYFEDLAVPADAITAQPAPQELHVCPTCTGGMVFPVEWEEAGPEHWEVALRCPDCEWQGSGLYSQESVERFDERLDAGTEAMVRDLKRLAHANMEGEIERFVQALDADLVVPEDF
ncbi:MAG: hypothetical protein JWO90_518 [Solirubrobacterales bacterium]|jgi:hypothetical protein|nr:hypothetical protein [Solirubrobacterales bacterium]